MDFTAFTDSWFAIGLAAITAAFALAAIAYALGVGFQLAALKAWAKDELYQIVGNLLLLAFLTVFIIPFLGGFLDAVAGSCPILCSAFCALPVNPGDIALGSIQCFLGDRGVELAGYGFMVTFVSVLLGIASQISVSMAPFGMGFSFSPLAGIGPINQLSTMLVSVAGIGISFVALQILLFSVIKAKLLVLMPIGIGLRCFPATRGAGAAVLGLFFGLTFMYPLLFLFEVKMVTADLLKLGLSAATSTLLAGVSLTNPVIASLLGVFTPVAVMNMFKSWGLMITYDTFIMAIFLPVFNLSIAFIFTRELSRLLGGELDVSALSRII